MNFQGVIRKSSKVARSPERGAQIEPAGAPERNIRSLLRVLGRASQGPPAGHRIGKPLADRFFHIGSLLRQIGGRRSSRVGGSDDNYGTGRWPKASIYVYNVAKLL